jgi:hypothetical protein
MVHTYRSLFCCYPTLAHSPLKVLARLLKCRGIEVAGREKVMLVLVVCSDALVLEPI